ncbi:MAG: hypothetical protein GEV07_09020 [Streptosporangiales bacterium]|nr:hypothetical protein [Streptosporangiales bacterium]
MTSLTDATDVFAAAGGEACVVLFLARRQHGVSRRSRLTAVAGVHTALDQLAADGWSLSVRHMFGESNSPACYATGFAHDIDFAGAFEAPDSQQALQGTIALEEAGWGTLARTEWLLGIREFAPVAPTTEPTDHPWGFIALWQWNDAWQAATAEERSAYDAECDVAFTHDVQGGARIAGRHRLDWSSRWHHVGLWEVPSVEMLDRAMREHERVADFKFGTSRHYVGRRRPLLALLEEDTDV